jgi:rhodanese-related sulfurtransferase
MIREITVRELADRLQAGQPVRLIDVRRPWEHEIAHLPNSQLIPLDQLQARADEVRPEPGALVVVYCHHGVRSLPCAAFLANRGVLDVCSLAGGIDAWSLEIDPSVPRY